MIRSVVATTFAIALSSSAVIAQTPAIVGSWDIEYAAGQRVQNGESTPIMAKGKLTITQRGDSLVASLVRASMGAAPPPPTGATGAIEMHGTLGKGGAVFIEKRNATVNVNGEAAQKEITLTWVLNASGDSLTGTLATVIRDGPPAREPAKVTGTRVRS